MNSNSFLTCLLTNGVCCIIRYWEKLGGGNEINFSLLESQKEKKTFIYLLQIDSRTRNDQIQEVGYVGWRQQFSLSDMAAEAPFQSTTGSRLQTHQQHAPDCKNNILS